jgi:hypothetical protein
MRTFPKELAAFRRLVEERCQQLRTCSLEELQRLGSEPVEQVIVESRPATVGIIVQPLPKGGVRVVVQGFMPARFIRSIKNVALDGFHKYPDGSVHPMSEKELYEFD